MKKLTKTLVFCSMVSLSATALSDPKPFDLELGKATVSQFKKQYPNAEYKGLNSSNKCITH